MLHRGQVHRVCEVVRDVEGHPDASALVHQCFLGWGPGWLIPAGAKPRSGHAALAGSPCEKTLIRCMSDSPLCGSGNHPGNPTLPPVARGVNGLGHAAPGPIGASSSQPPGQPCSGKNIKPARSSAPAGPLLIRSKRGAGSPGRTTATMSVRCSSATIAATLRAHVGCR